MDERRSQLTNLVSGLARGALNLLLPISCAVCSTEGRFVCADCEPQLPRLERPYCVRCSDPGREPLCDWCAATPPTVNGIRAPYVFEGAVRDLVHDLKYRNLRASAPELAGLMADGMPVEERPEPRRACAGPASQERRASAWIQPVSAPMQRAGEADRHPHAGTAAETKA